MGQKPTDDDVRDVMQSVGKTERDVITFEEFVGLVDPPPMRRKSTKSGPSEKEMKAAFKSESLLLQINIKRSLISLSHKNQFKDSYDSCLIH